MRRKTGKVYDVWMTRYDCAEPLRRYPNYIVTEEKIGSATSLEKGEELICGFLIRSHLGKKGVDGPDDIHSFHIVATPLDRYSVKDGRSEAYQYDARGKRLASRAAPFTGRDPGECPFRPGDLVEVVTPDMAYLAAVLITPPRRTAAGKTLLDSDTYWVVNRYGVEIEADTLTMFPPGLKIHPKTRAWFTGAVAEYRNRPVLRKIESAAGVARLRRMLSDAGLSGVVHGIDIAKEYFTVELQEVPGSEEDGGRMTVKVGRKALSRHPGRVEVYFKRLAGGHPEGRGYRARVESYDPDNPFTLYYESGRRYHLID